MTIEELRQELDRRESAAKLAQSEKQIERSRAITNYSMVALWGIVIGGILATCAMHIK